MACLEKGPDFSWNNGQCQKTPNQKLTGELSPGLGVVWEANTSNCDKVVTNNGNLYNNCAGIEANLPLATIDASDSEIFVEMTFNCQALSPKMVTMMLYEWSSAKGPILSGTIDNNQAFGEGLSRFQWKTKAKAGERPVIKLKLEPAGFLEPYKAGCQIELVKNSAQAI